MRKKEWDSERYPPADLYKMESTTADRAVFVVYLDWKGVEALDLFRQFREFKLSRCTYGS